jgi:hypothetical protein
MVRRIVPERNTTHPHRQLTLNRHLKEAPQRRARYGRKKIGKREVTVMALAKGMDHMSLKKLIDC